MHRGKRRAWVSLFDHLVGNGEQPWRDAEAECLGGVEVDHELDSLARESALKPPACIARRILGLRSLLGAH